MLAITNLKINSTNGGITIVMAMLLLVLALGSAVYSAQTKLLDIRIANAQLRKNQALLNAEAGLLQTIAQLSIMPQINDGIVNDAQIYTVEISPLLQAGLPVDSPMWHSDLVLKLTAQGYSDDGSSTVMLEQKLWLHAILRAIPNATITSAGKINIGGNFSIGANPHGAQLDMPLSVWSASSIAVSGNGATCAIEQYDQCDCNAFAYSNKTKINRDLYQDSRRSLGGSFPNDLFDYTFGIPSDNYWALKQLAQFQLTNCNQLNDATTGLVWVSGDCNINVNAVISSPQQPVILVIEDGDLILNGNAQLFGLVYLLDTKSCATNLLAQCSKVTLGGNAQIQGALISHADIELSGANFGIRFNHDILSKMEELEMEQYSTIEYLPGSWKDF